MPVLAKDAIWDAMADALDVRTPEQRRSALKGTFAVYYLIMRQLLEAGVGLIAEHNFRRGIAEPELEPCLLLSRALIVHCQTSMEVSASRFIQRYHRGERHRASFDEERIPLLLAGEVPDSWQTAEPLDLGVPVLRVDTTNEYAPSFEEITAFICSGA